LTDYLNDLEKAYNGLYGFYNFIERINFDSERREIIPYFLKIKLDNVSDWILPEHRLIVSKINIQSPGFWEVIGSLNPLQQIREYLNDRHERRKDKEWRERTEMEKAMLENQFIQRQIMETDNRTLKERIKIFRKLGLSDTNIRDLISKTLGEQLIALGKHQDAGMIKDAE